MPTTAAVAVLMSAVTGTATAGTVSTTPSASPSFDGPIHAVAYSGDTAYVGGAFSNVVIDGRRIPRQRLAAFNARTGDLLDWNPAADGTVRALTVANRTLYAAGDFTTVGGQTRSALAGITAAGTVTAFRHSLTGFPQALAAGNGLLYVGGTFTRVDKYARANAAAFSLTTGRLAAWAPRADNTVAALVAMGARVYLGGRFRSVGGLATARHLAAVSSSTGVVDRRFLPNPIQPVNGLAADASGIYAAQGGSGGRLVAYTIWGAARWVRLVDGDAQATTTLAGVVYVGGHFDRACSVATAVKGNACPGTSLTRGKLAAFSLAGVLLPWAPTANGVSGVRALAANAPLGQVMAGGDFTTVNGIVQKRYATFAMAPSLPG